MLKGELKINKEEIEGIIVYSFNLIDEAFLRWINQMYLLGPSVIDVFIIKRKMLNKILNEIIFC